MLRYLGILISSMLLVAGCGGSNSEDKSSSAQSSSPSASPSPSPTHSDQPKTPKAATAAAKEQTLRYTSGDFGGAWDMWTDDAKSVFSREDYIKLSKACSGTGIPLEVDPARLEGTDEAVVRVGLGNIKNAYTLKYEDGEWKWQPDPANLKIYRLGLKGAIKARKAEGSCNPG